MSSPEHFTQLAYPPARGRYAPRQVVESLYDIRISVVSGRPTADKFIHQIHAEMRRRNYRKNTIKEYLSCLRAFLNWLARPPHQATRADLLDFCLYLADSGRSPSTINGYISAIRTTFDRMCLRQITVGIVAPRKPKRLPTVLSRNEIQQLLQAAPSLRDTLILGLAYASGLRVSEVASLRYYDIDFDRNVITIRKGKGQRDRQVLLPETFRPLLATLSQQSAGHDYVFPSNRRSRHISPRTIQRIMKRALAVAQINKPATPHSLRHSFACHSFENGCDIRNIQKLLGHVRLDTTTIYVRVAKPCDPSRVRSPLDNSPYSASINPKQQNPAEQNAALTTTNQATTPGAKQKPVGRLRIHTKSVNPNETKVTLELICDTISKPQRNTFLTGIIATEPRPGWFNLTIPPMETWESTIATLPTPQRERIESPAFFSMLQQAIPRQLQANVNTRLNT